MHLSYCSLGWVDVPWVDVPQVVVPQIDVPLVDVLWVDVSWVDVLWVEVPCMGRRSEGQQIFSFYFKILSLQYSMLNLKNKLFIL